MNNNNGMTLVEVLISFFILLIVTAAAVPVFTQLTSERTALAQEYEAWVLLREQNEAWRYGNVSEDQAVFVAQDVQFVWEVKGTGRACMRWTAANQRNYQACEDIERTNGHNIN
ncbi:prepilin-type N-terminal cleavage/methylation domain-containing protein [Salsuginibacillus halophilus]|uniref:prepilin-type N-terminal cleavage/methylation domain-containing protein n=1 Tax=Salsuginibacillus halophilus TaxID=517424 RepID=UPI000D0D2941|nr:prepilin-type N-terminal cleavage/methylation domain-containing protein [Salsuginibacillus halophilus]